MIPLSERTKRIVEKLIQNERVEHVVTDLETKVIKYAGDITPETLERIRFAVLKIATNNNLSDFDNAFKAAVDLANVDWRDLLVNAGFAEDLAEHEKWAVKILSL